MTNIFEDPGLLMSYYEQQAAEFRMRHDAIFKQIKHYSWLLSLLLGSPVALLFAKDWQNGKTTITTLVPCLRTFPALGIAFSIIAFFVIRPEYHLYNETKGRLPYIEHALGLTAQEGFKDSRLKAAGPIFTVASYAVGDRRIGSILPWKARIPTLFMAGFVIFACLGAAELIASFTWAFR
jgi:hypothetical protein